LDRRSKFNISKTYPDFSEEPKEKIRTSSHLIQTILAFFYKNTKKTRCWGSKRVSGFRLSIAKIFQQRRLINQND